jgi:hypothetical protein
MSTNQNVQIPLSLFNNIVSLVEYLSIKGYEFPQIFKFIDIHQGLREKQHSLNKRIAYSNIIYSKGDERKEAQKNYQKLKRKRSIY